ncbi:hypothetical protein SAMN05421837_103275 [Amycolatopsis pretoriensis]|uniref:Uncharacterized protein n=1 Tax=Amycolatopsis pretoriensis TaxID=218821 RepID=A0A1H5QJR6_9PSEU|nr:hypothetical protein [Amycolatopsis pretoriensis]SEF26403.1 hypothetical protein SAMN05421837_103275 [Amycolatopsis pretoriensis]
MTDFAHVTAWSGRVRLALAPNTASVLHRTLTEVAARLGGSGRKRIADATLFPDAYRRRQPSAAFRDRHGAAMRAEVAAAFSRVLAAWDGATVLDLDLAGARDLRLVLAHAQSAYLRQPRWEVPADDLFATRWGSETKVAWLQELESHVATAALARDDVPVFLEL